MFVDLDWPLNASSLLSASAELLVARATRSIARLLLWQRGWMSHAGIVSKRLNLAWNFFDHLVAPSIRFFLWPQRPYPIPREPLSGGVKCTWMGKFEIFDLNRRLSRKRCEIGRWLLWNVNRKSWASDQMALFPMILSDLWLGFQGHDIYWSWISQNGAF